MVYLRWMNRKVKENEEQMFEMGKRQRRMDLNGWSLIWSLIGRRWSGSEEGKKNWIFDLRTLTINFLLWPIFINETLIMTKVSMLLRGRKAISLLRVHLFLYLPGRTCYSVQLYFILCCIMGTSFLMLLAPSSRVSLFGTYANIYRNEKYWFLLVIKFLLRVSSVETEGEQFRADARKCKKHYFPSADNKNKFGNSNGSSWFIIQIQCILRITLRFRQRLNKSFIFTSWSFLWLLCSLSV